MPGRLNSPAVIGGPSMALLEATETNPQMAVDFIASVFGPGTSDPVFLCSLPNDRATPGEPGEKRLMTRDLARVAQFVRRWDRSGRALYFCVGTLKPDARAARDGGSPRNKDNISETIALQVDIDAKDIAGSLEEALKAARSLPRRPSVIIASGNGLHCYWLLREPAGDPERVEAALRQLADLLGGDHQVAEIARLMRLPGTHNTKAGAWKRVEIIEADYDRRYELDEIEDMLSICSPVVSRREKVVALGAEPQNPFLAIAERLGFKPPIDVEQRLAAMALGGAGDSSIHQTQLSVSASLLTRGTPLEEVVSLLLDATRAAAGEFGSRWNWVREERAIRRMCETWVRKNPAREPRSEAPPARDAPSAEPPAGTVVSLNLARRKADQAKGVAKHIVVGQAVIGTMRERKVDVLFTSKGAWRFEEGVWAFAVDGLKAWLDVQIETACRALSLESTNRLVSEARQYISRDPALWREDVAWDQHGKIPTRSGLIDPKTLDVIPPSPEHYCTWRVEADYKPGAQCPKWIAMLEATFADRSPEIQAEIIGVLQEIVGASLIDSKPRPLSKGLILRGGTNYGKSEILEVIGGLHCASPITTKIKALEESHGLMAFLRRVPWVLHEAFEQGKWHFSSTVKTIITGEPVEINIKNGPILSQRVRAPIFWGTNYPPQFKEATKAIVNRLIVIECLTLFSTEKPVGIALEASNERYDSPGKYVLAKERSGILNWAIEGLRRASERGFIQLNDEMKESSEEIYRDSNLVTGFFEECVDFVPDMRVSGPDFCAAFSVWWLQNKGEDRHIPSNDSIGKAIAALGDPRIAMHTKELRDEKGRFYVGIMLTPAGISFWEMALKSKTFEGKAARMTPEGGEVNKTIPPSWEEKQIIKKWRMTLIRKTSVIPNPTSVIGDPSVMLTHPEPTSVMPTRHADASCGQVVDPKSKEVF